MASETYKYLRGLLSGEDPGWRYPDDLIYDVVPRSTSSSTKIIIKFDDDNDFLDVLDVDDDDRYTWNKFMGGFHQNYDYDIYRYTDDWAKGYIIRRFNDVNLEKIREIGKYLKPELDLREFTENNSMLISQTIFDYFESEVDDLIYLTAELEEECTRREMQKILTDETKDPFRNFGILEIGHAYKYETTLGVLLSLYRMLKAEEEDLKGLLTLLREKYLRIDIYGWRELVYNVSCSDFPEEDYQTKIGEILDNIIEDILEDEDFKENTSEFQKIHSAVRKLGGFNKNIAIPGKGDVIFTGLDRETSTLFYKFYKNSGEMEKRSLDNIDDFNLLISNYELFEQITRFKKLIL
jgi:hypothetical protein